MDTCASTSRPASQSGRVEAIAPQLPGGRRSDSTPTNRRGHERAHWQKATRPAAAYAIGDCPRTFDSCPASCRTASRETGAGSTCTSGNADESGTSCSGGSCPDESGAAMDALGAPAHECHRNLCKSRTIAAGFECEVGCTSASTRGAIGRHALADSSGTIFNDSMGQDRPVSSAGAGMLVKTCIVFFEREHAAPCGAD